MRWRGRKDPGCAAGGGDAGQREEGRRMLQIADEKPSEKQPIIVLLWPRNGGSDNRLHFTIHASKFPPFLLGHHSIQLLSYVECAGSDYYKPQYKFRRFTISLLSLLYFALLYFFTTVVFSTPVIESRIFPTFDRITEDNRSLESRRESRRVR